jgi:hypothetical protein
LTKKPLRDACDVLFETEWTDVEVLEARGCVGGDVSPLNTTIAATMSTTTPPASRIERQGRERSHCLPGDLCTPLISVLRSTQTWLPHTPTQPAA